MPSVAIIYSFAGSAASGVKDLDSMKYNSEGKAVCSTIESLAEEAQEVMKEEDEKEADT